MLIRDLTPQECREVLARTGFGRLGCAQDNQPYVVPIYFAYEPERLYSFTTVGQKIEWMRTNPKVCLEVDEVESHFQWMSVIVTGRYQELPNTRKFRTERQNALVALEKRVLWWQTAIAAKRWPVGHGTAEPLFYCIHIDSMTGLRAFPDAGEPRTGLAGQKRTS
jgi:nitroimidazol reductase NimA-like FMN-containing flavoprotein (pyridoxamine 5'-phosphate oxidase superfamily)